MPVTVLDAGENMWTLHAFLWKSSSACLNLSPEEPQFPLPFLGNIRQG